MINLHKKKSAAVLSPSAPNSITLRDTEQTSSKTDGGKYFIQWDWAQIITGFNYHLCVVPLVSHTSHFSPVLMSLGTPGLAGNLKVKAEQPEAHLDQVNEDVEIPHSNVPAQQLLQLHLWDARGQ